MHRALMGPHPDLVFVKTHASLVVEGVPLVTPEVLAAAMGRFGYL